MQPAFRPLASILHGPMLLQCQDIFCRTWTAHCSPEQHACAFYVVPSGPKRAGRAGSVVHLPIPTLGEISVLMWHPSSECRPDSDLGIAKQGL